MVVYPINHLPDVIPIGVQTENNVEIIGFDLKNWLQIFPGMPFEIYATRPGEESAYKVADQKMVGTVLCWQLDSYDTEYAGIGKVEIKGETPDQRKLSGSCSTKVRPTSLTDSIPPIPGVPKWYEGLVNEINAIKNQLDFGASNYGKLVYIGAGGKLIPLRLGAGLKLSNGVLSVTGSTTPPIEPDEPEEPDVVAFVQQDDGSILVQGVTFVNQEDGSVLWDGVTFGQMTDGSYLVS